MLADVLALTLFQLAFALALFDLITPSKNLSGGFFELHGAIALAASALAGLVSRSGGLLFRSADGIPPVVLYAVTLGALAFHTLLARAGKLLAARLAVIPAAAAGATLLVSRASVAPFEGRGIGAAWTAGGLVLGGLLFGAVVFAMNLGHWYLVSRTLPFQLLVRGAEAVAVLALARACFALLALGGVAARSAGEPGEAMASLLDPARDGLFFWSRVLWGLVAPVVLAPYVVKTARMKSNQAATGLLYVGVVFVMVGELLASYLTLRSGLPV